MMVPPYGMNTCTKEHKFHNLGGGIRGHQNNAFRVFKYMLESEEHFLRSNTFSLCCHTGLFQGSEPLTHKFHNLGRRLNGHHYQAFSFFSQHVCE